MEGIAAKPSVVCGFTGQLFKTLRKDHQLVMRAYTRPGNTVRTTAGIETGVQNFNVKDSAVGGRAWRARCPDSEQSRLGSDLQERHPWTASH